MSPRADEARVVDSGRTVLSVGPQDVDSAAAVTKNLGVHNKAVQLLQRHAKMYPPALRTALSRPRDEARTQFLREHPDLVDAVADAAASVRGRRRFFPEGGTVEAVNVHGDATSGRVLGILFRTPEPPDGSGRSARGVISYDAVPAIERAFAARDASAAPEDGAEPSIDVTLAEEQAREAEARAQELEQQVKALREQLDAAGNPEPWEGYEDTNAKDAVERISEGGFKEFGEQGLRRIIEFEEAQSRPRTSVIEAAAKALDAIPADGAEGDAQGS